MAKMEENGIGITFTVCETCKRVRELQRQVCDADDDARSIREFVEELWEAVSAGKDLAPLRQQWALRREMDSVDAMGR